MCFGVDTWLVDSAFARFWRILRGGLAHYRLDKSLRPPLESHQNHRKILESYATCLKAPESMDCHADKSARNDSKNTPSKKVDSRSNKNAEVLQSSNSQNATRRQDFGDKNGALQGESRAHTRSYVTADSPQQSPFLAQKPTPKLSQILTYKESK